MNASEPDDGALLDQLIEVFRTYGYDGASISLLSEATGLQRASLYYRYPGGKEEMAQAVMDRVDAWLTENIVGTLSGPGTPSQRLTAMAERVAAFYEGGAKSCLLDALSLGDATDPIRRHVHRAVKKWLGALVDLGVEAGLPRAEARARAELALVRIQGSLVLSRATQDRRPFRRALEDLPDLFVTGGEPT